MSILIEAEKVINGPRKETYGNPLIMCENIAKLWEPILGTKVSPEKVSLCMVQLKIAREVYKHQKDNLIDMCGYIGILERIIEEKNERDLEKD